MSESSSPYTPATPAAFVPKVDPSYYLSRNMRKLFEAIDNKAKESIAINALLTGPTGCGKTDAVQQFSALTNRPLLIMDCGHIREAQLWFGRMHVKDGTTYFKESDFFKAVAAGNHTICFDELNRVDSSVLATLMPALDGRRFTHIPDTDQLLRVGPNTVFCATINEGNEYTGTNTLDAAIRDRFSIRIEVNYLNSEDEIKVLIDRTGVDKNIAKKLVDVANAIRLKSVGYGSVLNQAISTRQLIACAELYNQIGNAAFEFTIVNHFSADGATTSERKQVLEMLQGKFGL